MIEDQSCAICCLAAGHPDLLRCNNCDLLVCCACFEIHEDNAICLWCAAIREDDHGIKPGLRQMAESE